MNTIRSVAEAIGFAIVLDGAGGIRDTVELAGAPWPEVPEPAVIVLDAGEARTAAWLAENAAFAPADRDAVLGPIRRTWAAPFDVQGERVAVLVLEELPHFGESMAEAGAAARDRDTLPLDPAGRSDAADADDRPGPRGPARRQRAHARLRSC